MARTNEDHDALVEAARLGRVLWALDQLIARGMHDGTEIHELRLRAPTEEGGDWLLVCKGTVDTQRLVAFHGAGSLGEALRGGYERLRNGQMKWREDMPYGKGS